MRDQHVLYRLVVYSHLGPSWLASLPVVDFTTSRDAHHAPITCMTLRVVDQSELIGLLINLHGNGLMVVSVNHLNPVPDSVPLAAHNFKTTEET